MKPARDRRRALLKATFGSSLLVNVIRFVWIVLIVWYEIGTFFWSASGCRWPDRVLRDAGYTYKPTHVLLVADPQVLDYRSYPGRASWLMVLTRFVVDLNIRKSWNVATRFRPNVVVFLGDMMDNGRYASSDAEYAAYYERFKSMFSIDPTTEIYYIPGNHDVGLGTSKSFSPRSRQRYITHFGPLNQRVTVANHTFMLLDAPGLVEEDYQRASTGLDFDHFNAPPKGSVHFIKEMAATGSEEPVILFSHIPLFRPDTAGCGPLRERGTIRRGVGYGYQNTLGKHTTQYLLNSVRPSLVFSGDDHDYCEYTHSIPLVEEGPDPTIDYVREVTVKSFSMAMGIKHPGFQLLSLVPPPIAPDYEYEYINDTFANAPCFLPDQLGIYTSRYVPFFLFTLVALFFAAWDEIATTRKRRAPNHLDLEVSSPPDGGMHLSTLSRPESAVRQVMSPTSDPSSPRPDSAQFANARTLRTPAPRSASLFPGLGGHDNVTPTLRASSRPGTPLDSPSLRPMPIPMSNGFSSGHGLDQYEDEDPMTPYGNVQYARRIVSNKPALNTLSDEEDSADMADYDNEESYFHLTSGLPLSTSGGRGRSHWAWSYSWTFVFRGRRRRMTVGIPATLVSFFSWIPGLSAWKVDESTRRRRAFSTESKGRSKRRKLLNTFLLTLIAAAWPPFFVFFLIVVWCFW